MRYSQLKAFHSVATHGGFSKAAGAVFITQPALSEHVRRLEQEHDVLLFTRGRNRVRLTPEGEQLFVLTKRLFEVEREVGDFLSASRAVVDGTLRMIIDSVTHITDYLTPFLDRYPNVYISIRTGNTEEMLNELRAYNAEIGIVGDLDVSGDFETIALGSSPIVAIAARDSEFSERPSLGFAELASLPLVFREPGSKTRQKIEEEAARRNVKLTPAIETEGREAMRDLVAGGLGVGFISASEFGSDSRLVSVALEDADIRMSESLVFLSQRKHLRVIRAFVDFMRSALTARQSGSDGSQAGSVCSVNTFRPR
jgi:aminoethylphosphonate catabolism LysR family transcriptional regulator